MGLSSSQARLLNLTARMHDIEYKAQNLEAQKLQMANESRQVYTEYENALNKQKVQFKQIGADGAANYIDASLQTLLDNGYRITLWVDTSEWVTYAKGTGVTAAATKENVYKVNDDGSISTTKFSADTKYKEINLNDPEVLRNMVEAGFIVFEKPMPDGSFSEVNIATDTSLQEVSDELDLKKAEAKYEADMRKIDAKDKKFDTDLAALEQERNAIKTEMDTLKTVAKDNVDRTFKLFS